MSTKSLLMWECGLKPRRPDRRIYTSRHSLCGSVDWNSRAIPPSPSRPKSLLMWECGLKHKTPFISYTTHIVTPYVGVWIETIKLWRPWELCRVTPYVGVWIETTFTLLSLYPTTVTPYVGVWIEPTIGMKLNPLTCVTPYVGVWIETA